MWKIVILLVCFVYLAHSAPQKPAEAEKPEPVMSAKWLGSEEFDSRVVLLRVKPIFEKKRLKDLSFHAFGWSMKSCNLGNDDGN